MKNFKKVLALVLAVVMLLSFATVASAVGSDFYEDVDDIDYKEAVDVLGAIGVLNGYPDDYFRPDNTITRAEAAKIIAMFDNQSSKINGLYASANPFSDCVGNWAESFIAYCAKTGIIAGMGGDKFAPSEKVTGVQFLKMVLVVLGYDAKAEGLEGKNWDVNTLALAKRVGLTETLTVKFDYSADLKRQEAAVIMLDALRADVVEYGSKFVLGTLKFDDETNRYYYGSKGDQPYMTVAGAVSTGDKLMKLWELGEGYAEDAFYRPYRTWKLDGKEIGRYMFAVQAEYTAQTDLCEVLNDTGIAKTNYKTSRTFWHCVNGSDYGNLTAQHDKIITADCTAKNNSVGHQGTLSQVFYVSEEVARANNTVAGYRITEIDTWLGTVSKVTKSTTNKGGHTVTDYTATIDAFSGNEGMHDPCLGTVHVTGEAGLTKGDFVLFNYSNCDDSVHNVDVVTGKTVDFDGFKNVNYPSQTKLDGEFIPDSWHFHAGYDMSKTRSEFGEKVAFFDRYGNVIGLFDTAAAADNYLVIDKMWIEYNKGDASLHANVVGLDAKVIEDVVIASLTNEYGQKATAEDLAAAGNTPTYDEFEWSKTPAFQYWYNNLTLTDAKYNITDGGYYILNDGDANTVSHVLTNVSFTEGDANVKSNGVGAFAVDKSTKFLINEGKGVYTAVTGANNLGTLTAANAEVVLSANGMADVVYLYGAVTRIGDSFTAYISQKTNMWAEGDYVYFNVYKDGVLVTLCTDKDDELAAAAPGFYEISFKKVGDTNLVSGTKLLTDEAHLWQWEVTDYADGAIFIEYAGAKTWIQLASDVVVYTIAEDGTVSVHDFDYDYIAGHGCYIMKNAAGTQVTEIYVVETVLD